MKAICFRFRFSQESVGDLFKSLTRTFHQPYGLQLRIRAVIRNPTTVQQLAGLHTFHTIIYFGILCTVLQTVRFKDNATNPYLSSCQACENRKDS